MIERVEPREGHVATSHVHVCGRASREEGPYIISISFLDAVRLKIGAKQPRAVTPVHAS